MQRFKVASPSCCASACSAASFRFTMPVMQHLYFQVLGQLSISDRGIASPIMRNAKACALLIYLWRTQSPQTRDALASLLWSETSTSQAKSNLRTLLTRLKRDVDGIETTRTSVAFWPKQRPDSDLSAIEAMLDTPLLLAEDNHAESMGDFLYGFVLSDAFGFNEWVSAERERIRQQLIAAWRHAANHFSTANEWEPVAVVSRRWRQTDPLDEDAWYFSVQAAVAVGNRTLARRIMADCHSLFQSELGIAPDDRLARLLDTQPTAPSHPQPACHPGDAVGSTRACGTTGCAPQAG